LGRLGRPLGQGSCITLWKQAPSPRVTMPNLAAPSQTVYERRSAGNMEPSRPPFKITSLSMTSY